MDVHTFNGLKSFAMANEVCSGIVITHCLPPSIGFTGFPLSSCIVVASDTHLFCFGLAPYRGTDVVNQTLDKPSLALAGFHPQACALRLLTRLFQASFPATVWSPKGLDLHLGSPYC